MLLKIAMILHSMRSRLSRKKKGPHVCLRKLKWRHRYISVHGIFKLALLALLNSIHYTSSFTVMKHSTSEIWLFSIAIGCITLYLTMFAIKVYHYFMWTEWHLTSYWLYLVKISDIVWWNVTKFGNCCTILPSSLLGRSLVRMVWR